MAGVFPLFVLYLAVIAQIIKPDSGAFTDALSKLIAAPTGMRAAVLWGNLFVFQLMANVFEQLLLEQYGIVLYLESKVRPFVQPLIGNQDFWDYERFQLKEKKTMSRFGEVATLFVVSLSLVLVVCELHNFILWDYFGLAANVVLWAWLMFNTIAVVRTRHEWEKLMR